MEREVESLVKLQEIDGQIIKIKKSLKEIPEEIDRLYASCRAAKAEIEAGEAEVKRAELKRKEIDIEVEAKKAALVKLQQNQSAVKTNKEYTAILSEIENVKKEILSLEDSELEEMEVIETKKGLIPPKVAALKEEEAKFGVIKGEKEKEVAGLKEDLAKLEEARLGIVGGVSSGWIGTYQKLLTQKGGLAVVKLLNSNCHGCHTDVPPQFVIEVRKGDKVITCPNCDRIVHYAE
ncbi:MAG: C4-type zinc ribbon domain-containing protein [Nitrospinota bacterium]|nr:hypothetical protein [Nitrospinota bacterium]